MNRTCIGYEGYECGASLNGTHNSTKRCEDCRIPARNQQNASSSKRSKLRKRVCPSVDCKTRLTKQYERYCGPCRIKNCVKKYHWNSAIKIADELGLKMSEVVPEKWEKYLIRKAEKKSAHSDFHMKIAIGQKQTSLNRKVPVTIKARIAMMNARKAEQYGRHSEAAAYRNYANLADQGRI